MPSPMIRGNVSVVVSTSRSNWLLLRIKATAPEYLPDSSLPSFNRPTFLTFTEKPPTIFLCFRQRPQTASQNHFDRQFTAFVNCRLDGLFRRRFLISEIRQRGKRIIANRVFSRWRASRRGLSGKR